MKIKRLSALVLAGMMVFSLSACGGSGDSGTSASGEDTSVQDIVDRGVMKVGVKADVPKFSLQDTATGEYVGFEDDLAYEIAGEIFGVTAD